MTSQTAALANDTHADPRHRKTTLRSFYQEWNTHQVWESNTRDAVDLAVNSATFADMPLSELRLSHVQAWVKSMQDKGLAPGTIKTRVTNVRNVLWAAVRDRVLGVDVSDGVKLPRQRKAAAAMVIPSAEEVGKVLANIDGRYVALIGLCAFAGLREGEAAALKVSDVDFLKREVHVTRQVQRVKGKVEYRPPKYGSERTVYAPEGLMNMLSEHVRVFCPGEDADRWLFPGEGEDSLYGAQVFYRWDCARDAAAVESRAAAGLFKQVGGCAYVVRTIGT